MTNRLRRWVRFELAVLICISSLHSVPVFAQKKNVVCEDALLSVKQIEVLKNAEQNYTSRVVVGEVNGIQRTVVLLGEAHLKGESASEQGKAVVDQFKEMGLEGARPEAHRSVAAWIFVKAVTAIYGAAKALGAKDSTIAYARNRTGADEQGLNIALEEGHSYRFTEQLGLGAIVAASAVEVAIVGGVVGYACMIPAGLITGDIQTALNGYVSLPIMGGIAYAWNLLTGSLMRKIMIFTLCGSRNEVMVGNIQKLLAERPDTTQLLVIVGNYHVDGMFNILLNSGFHYVRPNNSI